MRCGVRGISQRGSQIRRRHSARFMQQQHYLRLGIWQMNAAAKNLVQLLNVAINCVLYGGFNRDWRGRHIYVQPIKIHACGIHDVGHSRTKFR